MSDDLFDTTDIFKTNSLGASPLNENIDSQDKMEQVIAQFDDESKSSQYVLNVYNVKNTFFDINDSLESTQIESKSDLSSNQSSRLYPSEILNREDTGIQEEINENQISFQPFKEISQQQLNSINQLRNQTFNQNGDDNITKQSDMRNSYVDISKQIFSQYSQMNQANNLFNKTELQEINQQKLHIINEQFKNENKENISENNKIDFFEKGIGKIKELGDTIKNSLSKMQEKFNEAKVCVSSIAEEDKYKDMWDDRLNEFYNKLFSQASKALFVPQSTPGTPSKFMIQKPQSVYRFSTKGSVIKPLSIQQKKPSSVTKFNVPSMLTRPKSVLKQYNQQENNTQRNNDQSGRLDVRQKSQTVQKFNTNKSQANIKNHFGVITNSRNIKKESVKKASNKKEQKPQSMNQMQLGKENNNFFKK